MIAELLPQLLQILHHHFLLNLHAVKSCIQFQRFKTMCVCAQSCPILCDPVDCSPQISSVHGIFQSRTLERIPISYSKGFFLTQAWNPRLLISCPAGGFFITSTTAEIQDYPIFLVFSFINKKRLHNFSIKYFSNN